MKRKNVSILILVILVIIAFCWVLIPDKYTENYDWTLFIWVVPLCFFAIRVFSKQSSKKSSHQVIYAVTLGMIIPILLSTDRNNRLERTN
jgi:uncharacterized membrane protein